MCRARPPDMLEPSCPRVLLKAVMAKSRMIEVLGEDELLLPEGTEALCHATPASVGVATGPLALDGEAAGRIARTGTPPVLVRADAATEDIAAVAVAAGVLTRAGSRTSHAAVVARELGKPCLVGCSDLELDLTARTARIGGRMLAEGDVICLDAESGLVFPGSPALIEERPTKALGEVMAWRVAVDDGADGLQAARPTLTDGPSG